MQKSFPECDKKRRTPPFCTRFGAKKRVCIRLTISEDDNIMVDKETNALFYSSNRKNGNKKAASAVIIRMYQAYAPRPRKRLPPGAERKNAPACAEAPKRIYVSIPSDAVTAKWSDAIFFTVRALITRNPRTKM